MNDNIVVTIRRDVWDSVCYVSKENFEVWLKIRNIDAAISIDEHVNFKEAVNEIHKEHKIAIIVYKEEDLIKDRPRGLTHVDLDISGTDYWTYSIRDWLDYTVHDDIDGQILIDITLPLSSIIFYSILTKFFSVCDKFSKKDVLKLKDDFPYGKQVPTEGNTGECIENKTGVPRIHYYASQPNEKK